MIKNNNCNQFKKTLLSLFLIIPLSFSCDVLEKDKSAKTEINTTDSIIRSKILLQYGEDKILKEAQKNGYDDSIPFKKQLTNYIEQTLDYFTFSLEDTVSIIYTQLSIQDINFKSYTKSDSGVFDLTPKPHNYKNIISWLSDKNITCFINEKIVNLHFNENNFRNTLPTRIAYFKFNGLPYMYVSFSFVLNFKSNSYAPDILFQFDNNNNLIDHYFVDGYIFGDFDNDNSLDYADIKSFRLSDYPEAIKKTSIYNIKSGKELFTKFTLVKEERYD